jgi:hypothetical protein
MVVSNGGLMKKLTPKTANVVSMFLMVLIMTFVVVLVTTLVNYGTGPGFLVRWMRGWGLALIVAFPTVLVIMPIIKKLMLKITKRS